MTAAAPPLRHNPGFLPDDELVAGFVVREAELAALVETVRENTGAASIQHVLLVGRRGAGLQHPRPRTGGANPGQGVRQPGASTAGTDSAGAGQRGGDRIGHRGRRRPVAVAGR